jgi:hypothetical protein
LLQAKFLSMYQQVELAVESFENWQKMDLQLAAH